MPTMLTPRVGEVDKRNTGKLLLGPGAGAVLTERRDALMQALGGHPRRMLVLMLPNKDEVPVLTPIPCAGLCPVPPRLCCATSRDVCVGAPSRTRLPGRPLTGSWHLCLSRGRCREMGKSVGDLPEVIQPF